MTGAAGFIGSTLVGALLARGDEVVGVDALRPNYAPATKLRNLAENDSDRFTALPDDLNLLDMDELFDGSFDVVYHLAGAPGVRASWGERFGGYVEDNILATQRLLEGAVRADGLTRFVYASSSSAYGQARRFPTTEAEPARPLSPYGVTKLAAEDLVAVYRERYGLPAVSFRFFSVFGPRQRPDMAMARFLRAIADDEAVVVNGSGEQLRDFTFVDDVVDALVLAAHHADPLPPVMNLSGGTNASVLEVLALLEQITERPIVANHRPEAPGDVFETLGDNTLARQALGWEPRIGLREGLERQFEWHSRLLEHS